MLPQDAIGVRRAGWRRLRMFAGMNLIQHRAYGDSFAAEAARFEHAPDLRQPARIRRKLDDGRRLVLLLASTIDIDHGGLVINLRVDRELQLSQRFEKIFQIARLNGY